MFHAGYMDTDEIVHEGFPEEFALAKVQYSQIVDLATRGASPFSYFT